MKKQFTYQMADFVTCPWSEDQGGDLDGEHSDLFNHALTTLLEKKNDEAFEVNTMDTQWKQDTHITLSFIKTLEDLTPRVEALRDSATTLTQTLGTNLESVMFKSGYDEDIARVWVPISHLYRISLICFQYYVGLHTHLWKVATNYSWIHA
jgi:oligoendopeptidase F